MFIIYTKNYYLNFLGINLFNYNYSLTRFEPFQQLIYKNSTSRMKRVEKNLVVWKLNFCIILLVNGRLYIQIAIDKYNLYTLDFIRLYQHVITPY